MAEQVRFTIDHHQLRVVVSFMDLYLADPPYGEVHNLLHSIVGQQALGLKRKLLLQRLEYRLTMPVHFALAFRRMALAALEVLHEGSDLTAMRTLIAAVDPVTNRYTHVHA
jgi:hypothetical protein